MSGPYNPRWKGKKPLYGTGFKPILGKSGKTSGGTFNRVEPEIKVGPLFVKGEAGHESTSELAADVTKRLQELYAAELEAHIMGAAGGRFYTNSNPGAGTTSRDEILAKMREAMSSGRMYFNAAKQANDWAREYNSGEWEEPSRYDPRPRGQRNRNPGNVHVFEGELITAERKHYEPRYPKLLSNKMVGDKCVVSYRGSSLPLHDSERKTRSAEALRGTIAIFCRLIDQQKDMIP